MIYSAVSKRMLLHSYTQWNHGEQTWSPTENSITVAKNKKIQYFGRFGGGGGGEQLKVQF